MKASRAVPSKIFDAFLRSLELNAEMIDELAWSTGWSKAQPRKISLAQLLLGLSLESVQGEASFNDLSSRLHLLTQNSGPSRQAVSKRINEPLLKVLEALLAKAIAAKTDGPSLACQSPSLERYRRILIQDSTVVRLPGWLFTKFSGVSNAHQSVCHARIQAVYDIKNMAFLSFEICPYSDNDLAAAPRLELQKNDLVLRDRGYLTAAEVARHGKAGASCIYQHKTGTTYLDEESGKPIDLLAELRRNGSFERTVLLNNEEKTRVRLLSAPVSQEVANHRRMKAKKEAHGHSPSTEVLALMDSTLFLTSATEAMDFSSILTMRLILITEGTNVLYRACHRHVKEHHDRELSLQKFLKRLARSPELAEMIARAFNDVAEPPQAVREETRHTWDHLARYCCYDKRKRKNFFDLSNA